MLLGRETIYRDGERVGWLTSGGYGYTIGRSIGYGYVRNPSGVTADYVTSWFVRVGSRRRARGRRRLPAALLRPDEHQGEGLTQPAMRDEPPHAAHLSSRHSGTAAR